MAKFIIDKRTRDEFCEYFVGYSVSRKIREEFDYAEIDLDEDYDPSTTGERRTLVYQYYNTIDWSNWSDVRKIVSVFENALIDLEDLTENGNEIAEKKFRRLMRLVQKLDFPMRILA